MAHAPAHPCKRCRTQEAVHTIRSDPICSDCFCRFVTTKTVKRLEAISRETRQTGQTSGRPTAPAHAPHASPAARAFFVGLSFGPSSAALVDICEHLSQTQQAKGRDAAFTLHAVHIDTTELEQDPASPSPSSVVARLDRWRARYPRFTFESVPLSAVLGLPSIAWADLVGGEEDSSSSPAPSSSSPSHNHQHNSTPPQDRLRALLARLPSATSRRDVLDLLVRRLLFARAAGDLPAASPLPASPPPPPNPSRCDALLLGCSTTALAERTLAETAKGRGFALPWQINDGPVAVRGDDAATSASASLSSPALSVYYPLRELFRSELVLYGATTQPPLGDELVVATAGPLGGPAAPGAAVVSHRDLSIEDVMARYFAEVEATYPSVVANVVRTTAKLERRRGGGQDHHHGQDLPPGCGVCGMPLDEAGDERWKGEIGDRGPEPAAGGPVRTALCYGCERTLRG